MKVVAISQSHKCSVCGESNRKLYRYYGFFLRDEEIFCSNCAPDGLIEKQSLVPLIEDVDGSAWGYTSVPKMATEAWKSLPD